MSKKINVLSINIHYIQKFIMLLITSLTFSFLIWHTIFGNKGLLAYLKLKRIHEENIKNIDLARIEKLKILNKIMLLSDKSLDKDFLEEQARKTLDLAQEQEKIFIINNE
jgi:cell division protein FtsB